jgi:hypothetical protein
MAWRIEDGSGGGAEYAPPLPLSVLREQYTRAGIMAKPCLPGTAREIWRRRSPPPAITRERLPDRCARAWQNARESGYPVNDGPDGKPDPDFHGDFV